MAANSELIHAGLPWTNPQKVTIKSDEYVSDMTINRGFLNLLNNDYYLDLKTEAINKYIETSIDSHIADTDIHFSYSLIENLVNSLIGLNKNCVCYIPIYQDKKRYFDISQIKMLINNVAKNLNGFTVLFAFSIPISEVLKKGTGMSKESFKLSAIDINNTNKIGPKDLYFHLSEDDKNKLFTLDLDHYNLSFDNFQSR